MKRANIEFRECLNPSCGLRYPRPPLESGGERCPRCLGETRVAAERRWKPEGFPESPSQKLSFAVMLDNIRSAWNVGAIFRTADGLGARKLYLCGITPTPPHPGIHKTALGADESLEWEYAPNAVRLAAQLKTQGARLWALEEGEGARPIGEVLTGYGAAAAWDGQPRHVSLPIRYGSQATGGIGSGTGEMLRGQAASIVLILGNEIGGIDAGVLELCDEIVSIPMRGRKRSLNVEVAFAIAAWEISHFLEA
ncbi:MAG: TrmH family RNA methyltransferase [Anaerolineales bacterium]